MITLVNTLHIGNATASRAAKEAVNVDTLCSMVPQVAPTFGELFGVPQALTVAQVLPIDIGTAIWTAIAYREPPHAALAELPLAVTGLTGPGV